MSYVLLYTKSAEKELTRIPKSFEQGLKAKIALLSEDPFLSNSIKLKGFQNYYRVKYSKYRVIYAVFPARSIIKIMKIGHRKSIYFL